MNSDGLTMGMEELARILGISRSLCYQLARQQKLPISVIFIGQKRMVVSRKAVYDLLESKNNQKPG